jgi:hypothetical protein
MYMDVIMAAFYGVRMSEDDVCCAVQHQTRYWKFNFKIRDVCFEFIFLRLTRFYK